MVSVSLTVSITQLATGGSMSCGTCSEKTKVGASAATGAPTATGAVAGNTHHCPVCGKFARRDGACSDPECRTRAKAMMATGTVKLKTLKLKTFGLAFKHDYQIVATPSQTRAAELLNVKVNQIQRYGNHGSPEQRQIALAQPETVIHFARNSWFDGSTQKSQSHASNSDVLESYHQSIREWEPL